MEAFMIVAAVLCSPSHFIIVMESTFISYFAMWSIPFGSNHAHFQSYTNRKQS